VFVGDAGYGAWQWAWQAPGLAGPVETLSLASETALAGLLAYFLYRE